MVHCRWSLRGDRLTEIRQEAGHPLSNLGMAFGGQAVSLQAAVGFVRDGALDEAGLEGGDEVAFPEMFPVGQIQLLLNFFS
jgi:hypothetical protein